MMNERTGESGSRGVRVAVALSLALLLAATLFWFFGGPNVLAQGVEPEAPPTPQRIDESKCPLAETGIQGQVPIEDQLSGRSKKGYECGFDLVGQNKLKFKDPVTGERNVPRGANFQLAWYKNCAYVGQAGQYLGSPEEPDETEFNYQGIAVIDASNPEKPKRTDVLQSANGRHQHESVEVHPGRGLLTAQIGGLAAQYLEIYDISEDCSHPEKVGELDLEETYGHGNRISPDGKTVYISNLFQVGVGTGKPDALRAIDISDPSNPTEIPIGAAGAEGWDPLLEPNTNGNLESDTPFNDYGIHDMDITPNGKTLIAGAVEVPIEGDPDVERHVNQVLLDVSKIQNRNLDAAPTPPDTQPLVDVISESISENYGHTERFAKIDGTPYGFVSGESPGSTPPRCPGWGWGHVWKNTDPINPVEVSEIKLEVNHTSGCAEANQDEVNYSIHYDGADNKYFLDRKDADTNVVFYSWYGAGLRAFDVRNPKKPKEIAYYHPKPVEDTILTEDTTDFPPPYNFTQQNEFWDSVTSTVRYRPNGEVWVVSVGGGFQILKFTEPAGPPVECEEKDGENPDEVCKVSPS